MNNIEFLRQQIDDASHLLCSYEERLKEEPANFALRLTTQSLRAHLNDIQTQYRQAIEVTTSLDKIPSPSTLSHAKLFEIVPSNRKAELC